MTDPTTGNEPKKITDAVIKSSEIEPTMHTTLLQMSAECFAGMRAYHQSEIENRRDTVGIFTTILAANAALIAAAFGALQFGDHIAPETFWLVAVFMTVVTIVVCTTMLLTTLDKMSSDQSRYINFRDQQREANKLLGLGGEVRTPFGSATLLPELGPPKGTGKSKRILIAFFAVVIFFTLAGWGAAGIAWQAFA
jgi:hypothetical protein